MAGQSLVQMVNIGEESMSNSLDARHVEEKAGTEIICSDGSTLHVTATTRPCFSYNVITSSYLEQIGYKAEKLCTNCFLEVNNKCPTAIGIVVLEYIFDMNKERSSEAKFVVVEGRQDYVVFGEEEYEKSLIMRGNKVQTFARTPSSKEDKEENAKAKREQKERNEREVAAQRQARKPKDDKVGQVAEPKNAV